MQNYKKVAFILAVLVLTFIVGYLAFAWTGPSQVPPGGNVPAPINVGPTAQIKQGVLQINADFIANRLLDTSNNSYYIDPANTGISGLFAGMVGIGTTTPRTPLEVVGNIIADDPIEDNHVATKRYVDAASGNAGGNYITTTRVSFASSKYNCKGTLPEKPSPSEYSFYPKPWCFDGWEIVDVHNYQVPGARLGGDHLAPFPPTPPPDNYIPPTPPSEPMQFYPYPENQEQNYPHPELLQEKKFSPPSQNIVYRVYCWTITLCKKK